MRFITERDLREQFAGTIPNHYDLPSDSMLTPAARQYLMDLKIYQQGCGHQMRQAVMGSSKPEHMTHLNAHEMVCKDHPRIMLRGKLDTLESEILCLEITAAEPWNTRLHDALLLVRQILAADVKDCALLEWTLDGMTPEQIHDCSHHPNQFGFSGHILPSAEQGLFAAQLNRLRALSREVELVAVKAWRQSDRIYHEDCLLALNRLSSYFYVLQLLAVKEGVK